MNATAQHELRSIRRAVTIIAGDCGLINRVNLDPIGPAMTTLRTQFKDEFLERAEFAMAALSDDALQTACIGEDAARSAALDLLDAAAVSLIVMIYDVLLGAEEDA